MSSSRGPSRHVPSSAVRQACDRCHGKKLRCTGGRSPCDRCLRDSTACVFSPAGKSGRPTKATKQQPAEASQQTSDGSKSIAETCTASHNSVNGLPNNLFDDLETIDISVHPQIEASLNDPTHVPDFDFSAFFLLTDGPTDSTNLDEPTNPTEPAPREHVVYEMLEHLTRLQSRLLNHRASLADATTALQSGKTLTVPFSEILEPFFSDTHQVADIAVYLNTQGSRFRHREKLLKTLSVDTSCLLLCAPVMLMLDLYKQLLSLIDAALAEGKPRSLFTAAENPACSCCSAISRITWTDLAPPNLVFTAGAYPPDPESSSSAGPSSSSASNNTSTTNNTTAGSSSASASASSTSTSTNAPAPAPSPTPILDAFAKLPERIGGFAMSNSSSSSLSPGLRLWSLVGTLEFEVARLSQAVRLVEEKFPLLTIRGILKHTIASMREEMDAVLKIVGEVRGRCVVL